MNYLKINTRKVTIVCMIAVSLVVNRQEADAESIVAGVVNFDGRSPKRLAIQMKEKGGKFSDCNRLHENQLLEEKFMISKSGKLANVFVYARRGVEKKNYPLPKKPAILDQQKCMFRPRVQGIRVGQEFLMRNSDPLVHNVRSFSLRNRAFNIAQPAKTPDRKKVFTRGERAVMIQCDIHPWMTAHFFVMEHPYFAVTDEKGRFKITGLPAGDYTFAAWHEELDDQTQKITLSKDEKLDMKFTFKVKAR